MYKFFSFAVLLFIGQVAYCGSIEHVEGYVDDGTETNSYSGLLEDGNHLNVDIDDAHERSSEDLIQSHRTAHRDNGWQTYETDETIALKKIDPNTQQAVADNEIIYDKKTQKVSGKAEGYTITSTDDSIKVYNDKIELNVGKKNSKEIEDSKHKYQENDDPRYLSTYTHRKLSGDTKAIKDTLNAKGFQHTKTY